MNQWVLVTGAARRIGRSIAIDLADAGWDVVVHYNTSATDAGQTAKEVEAKGRKAHLVQADFSDRRTLEAFLPSLSDKIGALTALVNNASMFEPDSAAPGGGVQKAVNYEAARVLCEEFREFLPKGRKGAIVNLLDASPHTSGFNVYNQSKKSLRAMTLDMAFRFAPAIRVNGVAPGPTLPAVRETEEHYKKSIQATLLKTEIPPIAIASAVRFLIDNHSVTGEILHVDGGVRLVGTPAMYRAS